MINVLICIFIVVIFTLTTLMGYIFTLLVYVRLLIIWMTYLSVITELIALIIFLVYIGAMAVLFIYVRAVSPNKVIVSSVFNFSSLFSFRGLIVCIAAFVYGSIWRLSDLMNLNIVNEMFTGWGVYLRFFIASTLIIILAAVTFISPSSSTFRCNN